MSLPPEILKKVKMLELNTRKLVQNVFAGQYQTAFRGQGMTFADFREYVPGDDVRNISWALMARTDKVYLKKFDEEREMTLMLAVDVSGSADFGTGKYFKGEVITHLAACLGFAASKNNDHVGLVLFSDQIEHYVPPRKGRGHVQRILRDLYYYQPKSRRTRIASGLEYLQGVLKKRAHIFLCSDFMDQGYDAALRLLGKKHDVVAIVVSDPAENILPDIGVVDLHDAETGEIVTVDTSSRAFRSHYEKHVRQQGSERDRLLKQSQVDRIDVVSSENFVDPLIAYFQKRKRR